MKNKILQLKKEGVYFLNKLPSLKLFKTKIGYSNIFIICDNKLKPQIQPLAKDTNIYYVTSGEKLKDIINFPYHIQKIEKKISKSQKQPEVFIGIGGGSVTDFTGFLAHLYKRGRPVIHIPSTLLAAIDASHGGKTAMNLNLVKNFLGSYHFPEKVFIIKNLLNTTNISSSLLSANGELVKTAFLEGQTLYKKLKQAKGLLTFNQIWPLLPDAVQFKLKLVHQDPFEKLKSSTKARRRWLNLGHTLGHVLERALSLPHGQAVAMGTLFSILWSVEKKFLKPHTAQEMINILKKHTKQKSIPKIPQKQFMKLIREDKKLTASNKIEFVFLKNSGQPFVHPVTFNELFSFYKKIKI